MVTGRIKHDGFGAKSKIQKTERGPVRLLNRDGKLPRRPHALKSSWRISWCGGRRRVYNKEKKNGHLEKQMLRSFWIIQNNCTLDWVMCSSQFIPLLKHSGALPTQLPFLHSLNSYWPSSWSLAPSFSSKSSHHAAVREEIMKDYREHRLSPAHPRFESTTKQVSSIPWALLPSSV